jgi:uncharacterized protein YbbC (DUF1343 family)
MMNYATTVVLAFCAVVVTSAQVKFGIDNLIDTKFALLQGKRVVLVSHAAARSYRGKTTLEEFINARDVELVRLLTPEHGFHGVVIAGKHVLDDTVHSIPAKSLYGALRRPTRELLSGADVVVVDMQDIGVRSYTYMSTMIEVMDACAEFNVPCMILDRANPLGGVVVDGNLPSRDVMSFIGRLPVPYIHGMTLGELATMANDLGWLSLKNNVSPRRCELTVVRCKRLTRTMTWEDLARPWFPTSPNIPSIAAIRGYALTGLIGELGACSIGMGTTSPFQYIGMPDLIPDSAFIRDMQSAGVSMAVCMFAPQQGKYAGESCNGYYLQPTRTWRPYTAAMHALWYARGINPAAFPDTLASTSHGKMFVKATGLSLILSELKAHTSKAQLMEYSTEGLAGFIELCKKYLLYP